KINDYMECMHSWNITKMQVIDRGDPEMRWQAAYQRGDISGGVPAGRDLAVASGPGRPPAGGGVLDAEPLRGRPVSRRPRRLVAEAERALLSLRPAGSEWTFSVRAEDMVRGQSTS